MRRILVADSFQPILRAPGSLIARPTDDQSTTRTWQVFADDGARETALTATSLHTGSLALLPMGQDPWAGQLVALDWGGTASATQNDSIVSEVAGVSHQLAEGFRRGTTDHASAVAFDGLRAVYATGHVATDAPHGFSLDDHGARVGDVIQLTDARTSTLFDCLDATATTHAGALSVVDRSVQPPEWRMVEFSPDGSVLRTRRLDASQLVGCPRVYNAHDGFAIGFPTHAGLELHTFGPSETGSVRAIIGAIAANVVPGTPMNVLLWIGELSPGRLLILMRDDNLAGHFLRVAADGSLSPIPGDLPRISADIPAEAGRVFVRGELDSDAPKPDVVYELTCNLLAD